MYRFAADRMYNAQEVSQILRYDKDWDEKDLDGAETSMREADEELEVEQDDAQEENSLENEVPTLPVRGQTIIRDVPFGYLSFYHKMDMQVK